MFSLFAPKISVPGSDPTETGLAGSSLIGVCVDRFFFELGYASCFWCVVKFMVFFNVVELWGKKGKEGCG